MSNITTIEIDDSLDKLGDWDFFDEKVIGKFSGFKAVSGNVLGLRRRIIDEHTIYDEKKGRHNVDFMSHLSHVCLRNRFLATITW